MDFKVVIPAHYASARLPGKVLLEIRGKPIIEYVYNNACNSGAEQVVIATDDTRIAESARAFNAEICLTSDQHVSGTDRIAEAAQIHAWDDDTVIVNLQGDEPMMPGENIRQVAANLCRYPAASISTLCTTLTSEDETLDTNVVKVIHDERRMAISFSRNMQTFDQFGSHIVYRHLGIYAYRVGFLHSFTQWPRSRLEKQESLEQMRALEHGDLIHVELCKLTPGIGVDTREDYDALLQIM